MGSVSVLPAWLLSTVSHRLQLCCNYADVAGAGKSVIATDVLWSDPAPQPGLVENEARGVGLLFGPDITQVPSQCFEPLTQTLSALIFCT